VTQSFAPAQVTEKIEANARRARSIANRARDLMMRAAARHTLSAKV
jgi:hypothetical protein